MKSARQSDARENFRDSRPLRQVNCRNAGLSDYISNIVNGNALAGHNCDASGGFIHQLAEHGNPGLGIRTLTRGQNGAEAELNDLFQCHEGVPAYIKCPVEHQCHRLWLGGSVVGIFGTETVYRAEAIFRVITVRCCGLSCAYACFGGCDGACRCGAGCFCRGEAGCGLYHVMKGRKIEVAFRVERANYHAVYTNLATQADGFTHGVHLGL